MKSIKYTQTADPFGRRPDITIEKEYTEKDNKENILKLYKNLGVNKSIIIKVVNLHKYFFPFEKMYFDGNIITTNPVWNNSYGVNIIKLVSKGYNITRIKKEYKDLPFEWVVRLTEGEINDSSTN